MDSDRIQSERFMRRVLSGIALVFATWSSQVLAASVSLVDPIARVEYGKSSGTATLMLKIDGLDHLGLADKTLLGGVTDLNVQAEQSTVRRIIQAKELTPAGASSRFWILSMEVSGLSPGTSQSRWMPTASTAASICVALSHGSSSMSPAPRRLPKEPSD